MLLPIQTFLEQIIKIVKYIILNFIEFLFSNYFVTLIDMTSSHLIYFE